MGQRGGGGPHFLRELLGGNPWEAPERYDRAPIARVDRVRTPMLLLHGDHHTAPAIIWYTALREHGVECELVFYRGEGHVLEGSENREDLFRRSVAWFRAHGA